ncbi:MAG: hypothetical protein P4M05_28175 [Bradyrhizobium sp.]|nr:hypothetical protein [Bradyrhizobium sp.]
MLNVLVLICSINTAGADCDQHTAVDVIATAQVRTPQQCGFAGQALLAPTSVAPEPGKQYLKIMCIREHSLQHDPDREAEK